MVPESDLSVTTAARSTLEVFCYVLTLDNGEFLAIQEDLLLRMMDIIAASGTALAFPSRTVYARRDPGLDQEKTEAVSHEVQQWRENRKLTVSRLRVF